MNLLQAKTQLEKIIALYKSMSADEKNISAIERDLMLSYIRGLYENFLDTTIPTQAAAAPKVSAPTPAPPPVVVAPPPPPVVIEQPKYVPPPVVEQPKYVPPPVVEQPKYVPPPVVEQPKYVPPPVVVEKPRPVQPSAPDPVRYQEPAHEVMRYQTPPSSVSPSPNNRDASTVSSNVSPEIQALFDETSGKELSDKLANTPINDLTKAFGLNDRLLMQNELFANNKAVFDEILKDLNNASSFESARGYLVDFAKRYAWTANPERQRHAKVFIKVVRRRFK
jgi:hypothetical protein